MQNIKCVVVGDGAIGKSCMIYSYIYGVVSDEYVPTMMDNFQETVDLGNRIVSLQIYDTAGQEDHDRLRVLVYPNTDIFLICFSVINPTSYLNAREKWYPEVIKHCPNVPMFFVGTQTDLRNDDEIQQKLRKSKTKIKKPISAKKGISLTKDLKGIRYMECSAKICEGVKEVFVEAAKYITNPNPDKK